MDEASVLLSAGDRQFGGGVAGVLMKCVPEALEAQKKEPPKLGHLERAV